MITVRNNGGMVKTIPYGDTKGVSVMRINPAFFPRVAR